jgi:RNA polymerase sigma factor (sigma-70 family)
MSSQPHAGRTAVDTDRLVRQVLAGDTDTFATVVRRHEAEVWKVAAAMLGDRAATANLVQQTFVNAYLHLDQYRPGRDFGRWLKGIARNLVREELRRSRRENRVLDEYRDHLFTLYRDEGRAERRMAELDEAVLACRARLPAAASRALALHYDEGRTLEDIARVLERTVAGTRQLLFRARLALRQCVQERLALA